MNEKRKLELINKMRQRCLQKNCGAIKQLGCVFRRMDIDFSKKICFRELAQGVRMYGLDMTEDDLKVLFNAFDKDRNGAIDFHEFMHELRPPMSPSRIRVVNDAFDKLNVNKDGVLKAEDLKGNVC